MKLQTDKIRKLIGSFIYSIKQDIHDTYNIALSDDSISGPIKELDDCIYIGEWRIAEKGELFEAIYNEALSDEEDTEVVLEIIKSESKYALSDW